eukprot:4553990-Prymnesium_polylepis.1
MSRAHAEPCGEYSYGVRTHVSSPTDVWRTLRVLSLRSVSGPRRASETETRRAGIVAKNLAVILLGC